MKENKSGNMILRLVCGVYLLYLGIRIIRGEGVPAAYMIVGGVFIVFGGVVTISSIMRFFKNSMQQLEGEPEEGSETEPEADAAETPEIEPEADAAETPETGAEPEEVSEPETEPGTEPEEVPEPETEPDADETLEKDITAD